MNKKIVMGLIALAVSLMFTSGLMAQGTAPAPMAAPAATAAPAQAAKIEKFNGTIENVDMSKKDVVVEYHKDRMSFSFNDKTKVFEGTKELKLSDLKKGEWASVEYSKEGNQLVAHSIQVSPAKKSEPVASSGKATEKMVPTEKAPEAK
jgi:Cu/Ag efflux protein CusF